ncbi:MAG TPA: hypothetical protein EYQ46_14955, partial [Myxococcales bacterium]|nr:hypothetical protein [Myxococcales bacterium]
MSGNMPILLKRFVLSLLIAASLCASGAHAQIVRDNTPGQSNIGTIGSIEGIIEIDGADGITRADGELIVHSMSDFNVEVNETARYTDSRPADSNQVRPL